MTEHEHDDGISDEQARIIDRRLGQNFAFLRDVLERPELTDEIPTGATLAFRDVALAEAQVRLTAFRARDSARWGVRVTGVTGEPPPAPMDFLWAAHPLFRAATWESAGEAFDAIEDALRRAWSSPALTG